MERRQDNEKENWAKEHIWGILGVVSAMAAVIVGIRLEQPVVVSSLLGVLSAILVINEFIYRKIDRSYTTLLREIKKLEPGIESIFGTGCLEHRCAEMRERTTTGEIKGMWCFDWPEGRMPQYFKDEFEDIAGKPKLKISRLVNPDVEEFNECYKIRQQFLGATKDRSLKDRYVWKKTSAQGFECFLCHHSEEESPPYTELLLIVKPRAGIRTPELGFYSSNRGDIGKAIVAGIEAWYDNLPSGDF